MSSMLCNSCILKVWLICTPRKAEACKYKHNADEKGQFISAEYIEGSERMVDLPSYVDQWKDDYKRRFRNGKSTQ